MHARISQTEISSKDVFEKLSVDLKSVELDSFTQYTQNSKWVRDLNIIPDNVKL